MPFEILETVARDTRVAMASVSYERGKGRNGVIRDRRPRLRVSIPTVFAGLCKRDRFRIDVGTGADAGRARISGLAKGVPGASAPGTMMKNALVVRFGFVPMLGEDAAAKEFVPVRKLDDNTWEIDLPPWFKAEDEHSA